MSESLPISVTISALNEEHRIKDAILSARENGPAEVIVVEGGSTDKTYDVSLQYADRVYKAESFGLGYKRRLGVLKATQPYVLVMDADQVLERGHLKILLDDLLKSGWTGIQPQLTSYVNNTYWEEAMEAMLSLSHGVYGERNVIGTPSLYRRDILLNFNFNPNVIGSCDCTDLSYRLVKAGHRLGISNAVCYQKHRVNFKQVCRKFYWYGQGDVQFAIMHPERAVSIFLHPIKNYMILKTIALIRRGRIKYSPFTVIGGFIRHCGFWKGLLNSLIKKRRTDSRIENRNDFNY